MWMACQQKSTCITVEHMWIQRWEAASILHQLFWPSLLYTALLALWSRSMNFERLKFVSIATKEPILFAAIMENLFVDCYIAGLLIANHAGIKIVMKTVPKIFTKWAMMPFLISSVEESVEKKINVLFTISIFDAKQPSVIKSVMTINQTRKQDMKVLPKMYWTVLWKHQSDFIFIHDIYIL